MLVSFCLSQSSALGPNPGSSIRERLQRYDWFLKTTPLPEVKYVHMPFQGPGSMKANESSSCFFWIT